MKKENEFHGLQHERDALMQTKRKQATRRSLRSWANLALADECLGGLQTPTAKTCAARLSVVPDTTEEEIEALAPTMGIINGIRLSLTLWSLIGLIILLMR
ncbi:MAG TPA: hypothetical protein VLA67_09840 [Nitrospiraceae bacterium]|nr:hypothetical protein [Nitrospiraceae bacterium]